MHLSPRLEIFS